MTRDEVFEVIKQTTLEVLPDVAPDAVTIDRSLPDLGANSVDRAEVVVRVMEALDLRVPLVELRAVRDLRGLTEAFYRKVSGEG